MSDKLKCYCCKENKFDFLLHTYELKKDGTVDICIECENDTETYFDVIKRECLLDGQSYDVTTADEKEIRLAKEIRLEKEEEERVFDCDKSIFYFNNMPLKKPETNHQVLGYINEFINADEENMDHIQRFKFNHGIGKHWDIGQWSGLAGVNVYLDTVKKEHEKVKNPSETEWRDRVRKWYSGRFECDEDFYNVTFGFSQYDDGDYGRVCVSYDFLCSKSKDVSELIEGLIAEETYYE